MLGGSITQDAKDAIAGALVLARAERAPYVLPEHLLMYMLEHPGTPAGSILDRCGVTGAKESVAAAIDSAHRRGGLSAADTDALAELGIDVEAVVDRVERSAGEYALATAVRARRRRWRWRHAPVFSAELVTVVKSARPEMKDVRARRLEDTHLLLALLRGSGLVREILERRGLTYTIARAARRP